MGEMADSTLDDMFDDMIDREWECPVVGLTTCNRCGEEDLHWEASNDSTSILCDEDRERHVCTPDAKGFEAL